MISVSHYSYVYRSKNCSLINSTTIHSQQSKPQPKNVTLRKGRKPSKENSISALQLTQGLFKRISKSLYHIAQSSPHPLKCYCFPETSTIKKVTMMKRGKIQNSLSKTMHLSKKSKQNVSVVLDRTVHSLGRLNTELLCKKVHQNNSSGLHAHLEAELFFPQNTTNSNLKMKK